MERFGAENPMTILLVDDDPDDLWFLRKHLHEPSGRVRISEVNSRESTLDYLKQRGAFTDAGRSPRPNLIILDLHLGRRPYGLDLLREIKSDARLRSIPVVVFSISEDERLIAAAYEHGAAAFVPKASRHANLSETIRGIRQFWLEIVHLPG
jgi:CheY-like chemotaxis protein